MLIYEIVEAFDKAKLDYAIIGGYALALHGVVRATINVDIVLSLRLADYTLAETILGQLGLKSRIPVRAQDIIKMRQEYIANRSLLAWSFVDYADPTRQLDILITKDLREIKVEKISVGGKKIKVICLADLLNMKQESGRPQDLIDIKSIKDLIGKK